MEMKFLKIVFVQFLGQTKQSNFSQYMFWFALSIILILIDQLTKLMATQLGWPIFLNDQFAFSLPLPIALMYAIYFVVLTGMSTYVYKTWQRFNSMQRNAWAFVFAGGISNIGERILTGHVKDFIPIANGMLNIADLFILLGLVLLLASNRYNDNSEKFS
jgi:lipoprotein signal peptidase